MFSFFCVFFVSSWFMPLCDKYRMLKSRAYHAVVILHHQTLGGSTGLLFFGAVACSSELPFAHFLHAAQTAEQKKPMSREVINAEWQSVFSWKQRRRRSDGNQKEIHATKQTNHSGCTWPAQGTVLSPFLPAAVSRNTQITLQLWGEWVTNKRQESLQTRVWTLLSRPPSSSQRMSKSAAQLINQTAADWTDKD